MQTPPVPWARRAQALTPPGHVLLGVGLRLAQGQEARGHPERTRWSCPTNRGSTRLFSVPGLGCGHRGGLAPSSRGLVGNTAT